MWIKPNSQDFVDAVNDMFGFLGQTTKMDIKDLYCFTENQQRRIIMLIVNYTKESEGNKKIQIGKSFLEMMPLNLIK